MVFFFLTILLGVFILSWIILKFFLSHPFVIFFLERLPHGLVGVPSFENLYVCL